LSIDPAARPVRLAPGLSLLVVAALFAGALAGFTPAFRSNDDTVMAMIASGIGIATVPDPHLVYIHLDLGRLLAALYRRAPAVPWYGLLQVVAQLAAHAAVLGVLLTDAPWRRALAAYLLFALAVGLPLLITLQFTTTACVVTSAGFLCLLSSPGPPGLEPSWRRAAVGTALAVLGSLIRIEAFALTLLVALPVVIVVLARRDRAGRATTIAALVAILLGAGALRLRDRAVYARDPGWASFLELIHALSPLVNFGRAPYGPDTADLYARLGWSQNDAALLFSWYYAEPDVFPAERMRALVAAAAARRPVLDGAVAHRQLGIAYDRDPAPLWTMALVLPALICLQPRGGRRGLALVVTAVSAAAVVLGLALFGRAPPHVVQPAFAFVLCVALADLSAPGRPWPTAAAVVAGLLAMAGVGAGVESARADSEAARAGNARLRASIAALAPRPDRLYVAWSTAFPYRYVLPLEDTGYLKDLRLFSLGWPQRSPIADRMLRSFGASDLYEALLVRPDVLLIAQPGRLPLLERYGRERRGFEAQFTVESETPSFVVYRGQAAGAATRQR
jgi:hypothetical protein